MKGASKLKPPIFERYTDFLVCSGLLRNGWVLNQHMVKHRQLNKEDCGVYCAIFARNVMTGENFDFHDTDSVSREIRELIAQSIYLCKDIRGMQDRLRLSPEADDRIDLK